MPGFQASSPHFFGAAEERHSALEGSLAVLEKADLYIVVVGRNYGDVAPGQKISSTELELERAVALGLPSLTFEMADDHPVRTRSLDAWAPSGHPLVIEV